MPTPDLHIAIQCNTKHLLTTNSIHRCCFISRSKNVSQSNFTQTIHNKNQPPNQQLQKQNIVAATAATNATTPHTHQLHQLKKKPPITTKSNIKHTKKITAK
jgi:hypothetical protein